MGTGTTSFMRPCFSLGKWTFFCPKIDPQVAFSRETPLLCWNSPTDPYGTWVLVISCGLSSELSGLITDSLKFSNSNVSLFLCMFFKILRNSFFWFFISLSLMCRKLNFLWFENFRGDSLWDFFSKLKLFRKMKRSLGEMLEARK